MNLSPIATDTLTQKAAAPVNLLAGAASSGLSSLGASSSNPLAQLAQLGNAPSRGVAATVQFQQTLASALADILSRVNISGNQDDGSDQGSSSIVPDFTKTMMPLQLSLALNSFNNLSLASKLPGNSSSTSSNASDVVGGGTTPGGQA